MAKQTAVNILEFQKQFGTDEACRDHPSRIRWPDGLVCPKCGRKTFYKITSRNIYECKCGHQVSLTAGTIMYGSRTPSRKWFWAIYPAVRPGGKKHLPAYPNEFCFRINRRRFDNQLFNRLLNACMLSPSITYRNLVYPVPS